ncbi:hypothetical protein DM02DRAFT_590107 [Periconia macrospinosa]|uniref:Uncharacterized protein n=1 Tax=Periconia macrospinosa TaxID=97972 RepID=A0A2V1DXH8_9PLEO|nr:hypothetical protein DM02DRAFT_590107 [Periconia macrospinosa]
MIMAQYSPVNLVDTPSALHDRNAKKPQHSTVIPDNDSSRPSYYEFKEWLWEIVAWFIGTLIIVGAVVLLKKLDQTPVRDWPINIQPSTVITAMAYAIQSALLVATQACISQLKWSSFKQSRRTIDLERYDQASRGPYGSMKILFRLSRKPRLVHLGAIATVLMVVFSAFFQQALETRLKEVEDSTGVSSLTYATDYKPQTDLPIYIQKNGKSYGADQYLANAIISSMAVNSKDITDNPAVCPSGQCKFPSYTTLALCHSIENVTSQLVKQPTNATTDSKQVTLPGFKVSTEKSLTFWGTTLFRYENQTRVEGQRANETMLSLNRSNSKMDDLAHIYLAYHDPCLTTDAGMQFHPNSWRAYKATIRLCLQTRSTEVNSASTRTTVTQTHLELPWHYNAAGSFWSTHLDDNPNNYTIDFGSPEQIGQQIALLFNVPGSWIRGGDKYLYNDNSGSNLVADILGNDVEKCPNTTGYGFEGFTRRVAHVTNGVTNAFLTSKNSKTLAGASIQTIQYYQVTLWLLAFPGALFLLITIFFISTVLYTTNVPLWKSSQLAVLYTMSKPEHLATKSAMEKRAKTTHVAFAEEDWCLKDR